jgi:hypothetical protein
MRSRDVEVSPRGLAGHVQRRGPIHDRMARDLAASRRECATLRRKNEEFRAQLAILGAESAAEVDRPSPEWPDWVAEEPGLWA